MFSGLVMTVRTAYSERRFGISLLRSMMAGLRKRSGRCVNSTIGIFSLKDGSSSQGIICSFPGAGRTDGPGPACEGCSGPSVTAECMCSTPTISLAPSKPFTTWLSGVVNDGTVSTYVRALWERLDRKLDEMTGDRGLYSQHPASGPRLRVPFLRPWDGLSI